MRNYIVDADYQFEHNFLKSSIIPGQIKNDIVGMSPIEVYDMLQRMKEQPEWYAETVTIISNYRTSGKTAFEDQNYWKLEMESLKNELKYLKDNGIKYEIINFGTKNEIRRILTDPKTEILYITGHGYESINKIEKGIIRTSDGELIVPHTFSKEKISKNIELLIVSSCYQGD